MHVQVGPLMGKQVEIHGTSQADMNGKCGVATDFHPMDDDDPTTWRYTVKLDGQPFHFKVKLVELKGSFRWPGLEWHNTHWPPYPLPSEYINFVH
jgi:hypothetical protein